MIFIGILVLTTLTIAGSAAFFSIHGLAQIFTGAFWPVVIMATSLELGKLVSASYVYRFWNDIKVLMRAYLIIAILILMVITSAGIFGFLSSAYQQDILPLELMEQKITLLQDDKVEMELLKAERLDRRKQIDADIAALPNNFVTGRQKLMASYGPELEQIRTDIDQYTTDIRYTTLEIQELKAGALQTQSEIGPIIFIAESLGQEVGDATKWLILLIIIAFDPLAVVLTIGTNIAIVKHKKKTSDVFSEPEPEIDSIDQLSSIPIQPNNPPQAQPMQNENLEQLLARLESQEELTDEELEQRDMLSQMISKQNVTNTIRSGAATDHNSTPTASFGPSTLDKP